MAKDIILINFKIIVTIVISLACLLTLILLKEKKMLSVLIKHSTKKKEESAPLIYPLPQKSLLNYLFLVYLNCKRSFLAFTKTEAWKNIQLLSKISLAAIGVRLAILLIVYVGLVVNGSGRLEPGATFFNSIEKVWSNVWDTHHYLRIARDWYVNEGEPRLIIVFFPLYPFLMHLVYQVVQNYFYSGFIISNVCLVIACFYLYKLTQKLFTKKAAAASIKFMLIFPYSFFFGIVYTESLFLMLSIMTFYYALRKDWVLASILAMLATLSRIQGILLLLPLLCEYFQSDTLKQKLIRKSYIANTVYILKTASFFLLIPLGLFIYLLINKIVTGDWFKFLEYQRLNWSQTMGFFAENLKMHFDHFLHDTDGGRLGLWFPHLVSFTMATFLIFYSFKKMRLSFTIYMLAYLIVSYSPTWLLSGSRYISALFPIYILIALLAKKDIVDKSLTFVSTMLLSFLSLAFFTTAYIM